MFRLLCISDVRKLRITALLCSVLAGCLAAPGQNRDEELEAQRTCVSIGKDCCHRAPELVYVPGDLAAPLDWDALNVQGLCVRQPALALEIQLKAAPGEKRYIDCLTAGGLASRRQRLIALGLKP